MYKESRVLMMQNDEENWIVIIKGKEVSKCVNMCLNVLGKAEARADA